MRRCQIRDGKFVLPTLEEIGRAPIRALGRQANFDVDKLRESSGKTVEVLVGGETFLGTFETLPNTNLGGWLIGAVVPEQDFLGQLQRDALKSLGVGFLVIVLVIYLAVLIARVLTKPLALIEEETRKIQSLDLAGDTPTSAFGEISDVLSAFDRMKRALRAFKLYVPAKLVGTLIEEEAEPRLGGVRRKSQYFSRTSKGFPRSQRKLIQVSWPQSSVITCNALPTRFMLQGEPLISISAMPSWHFGMPQNGSSITKRRQSMQRTDARRLSRLSVKKDSRLVPESASIPLRSLSAISVPVTA